MAKRIHLNDNRAAILSLVGEYGLLDSRMIHQRCMQHVSYRRVQQILSELVDATLLSVTILTQAETKRCGKSRKLVTRRLPGILTLKENGAEALEAYCGEQARRISRSDPAPETLRHRHEIVKTRLAFDDACAIAGLAPPNWIMESDQRNAIGQTPKLPPNQKKLLYHRFEAANTTVTCQPDLVGHFQLPPSRDDEQIQNLIAACEVDRSSEGVNQLRRSKGRGYDLWLNQKCYQSYWPDLSLDNQIVRIMWIVPSESRIVSIMKADNDTQSKRLYRFINFHDRDNNNVVTDPVWMHPNGARSAIFIR